MQLREGLRLWKEATPQEESALMNPEWNMQLREGLRLRKEATLQEEGAPMKNPERN